MRSLSLTTKRVLAGCYTGALCLCALSYYLGWNLFGGFDRKVLAVVTFVGVVLAHRYGRDLISELAADRDRRGDGRGSNV